MEHPPDPTDPNSGCVEVDHQDCIALVRLEHEEGVKCFLRNTKSGEQVTVQGQSVQLHFSGNRAFVVQCEQQGEKTTWVRDFLKKSVWRSPDGDEFVCELSKDGNVRRWLSEMANQKDMSVVPLQIGTSCAQLHIWTFRTRAVSSSQRWGQVFYELCWFLKAVNHTADHKHVSKKWRQSWCGMMARRGFNEGHSLIPYKANGSDKKFGEGMCSDELAISTPATIHFLVHLSQTDAKLVILESFIKDFLPCGSLEIKVPGQTLEVMVHNDGIVMSDDFQNQIFREKGWKSAGKFGSLPLATVLKQLEPCKSSHKLYEALLVAMGERIEQKWLLENHVGQTCVRLQAKIARTKCEESLAAKDSLQLKRKGSSSSDLPSTSSSKKSKTSSMEASFTAHERYQYWLASRRAFLQHSQICLVDDDSTVGGRHRQVSVLMNLCSGEACWAPPIAA